MVELFWMLMFRLHAMNAPGKFATINSMAFPPLRWQRRYWARPSWGSIPSTQFHTHVPRLHHPHPPILAIQPCPHLSVLTWHTSDGFCLLLPHPLALGPSPWLAPSTPLTGAQRPAPSVERHDASVLQGRLTSGLVPRPD